MEMSCLYTAQEGDRFCVPEMKIIYCKMCVPICQNNNYKPCKDVSEAGKSEIIHRETSHGLTQTERSLSRDEAAKPKSQIVYKCTREKKKLHLQRHVLWSEETEIELSIPNYYC